jgi:hypothetical protein
MRPRSKLVLFAALTAILGLWARVGHMTLVAHDLCLEHGELTHADPHADHAGHGARADDDRMQASEDRSADENHDHCHGLVHESAVPCVHGADAPALLSWQLVVWTPSAFVHARASRLYRLAPKTSPPRST